MKKRISLGIEQEDYRKLEDISISKGISVSNLCRQIISYEINEKIEKFEKLEHRLQSIESLQTYFDDNIRIVNQAINRLQRENKN